MMKVKKSLKSNKGITLIALVITIIVLLILAGVAISMLSGDNGILKQAVKAKEETEKKSIQENIQLAVLSAMSNTNHELTLDNLTAEVKKQLGSDVEVEQDGIGGYVVGKNLDENGHLTDVYGVVDKEGKVGEGKWHFVKLTDAEEAVYKNGNVIISDGETTLIVGNKIDYDAKIDENGNAVEKIYLSESTKNGSEKNYVYRTSKYTKDWGILGAENGKILIASMYSILGKETESKEQEETDEDTTGSYISDLHLVGQLGYQYAEKELNEISKIYGYGKGAEVSRSIKIEDINKITGYDPNYVGQNVNKTEKEELKLKKYGERTIGEYGNQVEYYWNESDNQPIYEGSNGVTGRLYNPNLFNYYNSGWKISQKPSNTDTKQYITTLINTLYKYVPEILSEESSDDEISEIGLSKESKAYKMLFEGTDKTANDDTNGWYWLGSTFVYCATGGPINFGLQRIYAGGVYGGTLFYSHGVADDVYRGVRPAVTLKANVIITKTGSEENEEYHIN